MSIPILSGFIMGLGKYLKTLALEICQVVKLVLPKERTRFSASKKAFRSLWKSFYLEGGLKVTTLDSCNTPDLPRGFQTLIQADGDILLFHSKQMNNEFSLWKQHLQAIRDELKTFQEHVLLVKKTFYGLANIVAMPGIYLLVTSLDIEDKNLLTTLALKSILFFLFWLVGCMPLRKVMLHVGLFCIRKKCPVQI